MIGVCDSGSGGLTVFQQLADLFPQKDLIYFGDHAHCPYGLRSREDVYRLTQSACRTLFEQGCRVVVLACNTATAVALRDLQQNWLPISPYSQNRILGIIAPTVEALTGQPWQNMGVPAPQAASGLYAFFATHRTVESRVYDIELKKRVQHVDVIAQECPNLAGDIEEGASHEVIEASITHAVTEVLRKAGTRPLRRAVLGCTHYGLVEELFRKALPADVPLLSQGEIVAQSFKNYLTRHPEYNVVGTGRRLYLTTGNPEAAARTARLLLGAILPYQQIMAEAA